MCVFRVYFTLFQALPYLEFGQVLQLGEIGEFQEQAVDANPAEAVDDVEPEPGQEHQDVVDEDHVVDDPGKDPGHDLPGCENSHGPQPEPERLLVLLAQSVQQHAAGDEENDTADHGKH